MFLLVMLALLQGTTADAPVAQRGSVEIAVHQDCAQFSNSPIDVKTADKSTKRHLLNTLIACAQDGLNPDEILFQTRWSKKTGRMLAVSEGFYDIAEAFHTIDEEIRAKDKKKSAFHAWKGKGSGVGTPVQWDDDIHEEEEVYSGPDCKEFKIYLIDVSAANSAEKRSWLKKMIDCVKWGLDVDDLYFQTPWVMATGLMLATQEGFADLVDELLTVHHAHPDIQDSENTTAAMLAALEGREDVMKSLIKHGADINLRGAFGFTPLMEAAHAGHGRIVAQLLKAKADMDIMNDDSQTALMLAIQQEHENIVAGLLEAGANPNVTDRFGSTALIQAVKRGNGPIVTALLSKGVDVNAKDNGGETALTWAWSGHSTIVSELRAHGAARHRDQLHN